MSILALNTPPNAPPNLPPPIEPPRAQLPGPPIPPRYVAVNEVRVVDIDMPFGSMIGFMVKWAIASIPAIFILSIIFAICWMVLIAGVAALGLAIKGS